ncbi:MAG: type II secretion system F family protein [Planctomycetota bacterium]
MSITQDESLPRIDGHAAASTATCTARVGTEAKHNVLVTLALQLETGVAITAALSQQAELSPDQPTQAVCAAMAQSLLDGSTLAAAASRCPGLFEPPEVAMLEYGERSGDLPGAVRTIAEELEWRTRLASHTSRAMLYPWILLNVGFLALNVRMLVLGEVAAFFIDCLLFNLILYACWLIGSRGTTVSSVRGLLDQLALSIPPLRWWVGNALLSHHKALFFGSLARAFRAGMPVADTIERASDLLGSPVVRRDFLRPAGAIANGKSVSESFRDLEYLGAHEHALIASGEEAGQLDRMFDTLARSAREDFENWLHVFTRLFPLVVYLLAVSWIVIQIL